MLTPAIIAKLLDGSPQDRNQLAGEILAMVDTAVFYTLRTFPRSLQRREDFVQDVMAVLFRAGGRYLRNWDPGRGSLTGYVRMIARQHCIRELNRPSQTVTLVELDPARPYRAATDVETQVALDAALEEVSDWIDQRGSDKDKARFESLYVDLRGAAETAAREGATVGAIYAWNSRFVKNIGHALPHVVELLRAIGLGGPNEPQ